MAEIVLVHGIGQQQKSPDTVESEYLPNLAGGIRLAGDPGLADRIWRNARPGDLSARVAFYGDLFRQADQQGDQFDLPPEAAGIAAQLTLDWAQQIADHGTRETDRERARRALEQAEGTLPDAQGLRAGLRPVLNALTRIRPMAALGEAVAGRLLRTAIIQVSRYLTDDTIRAAVQDRVAVLIGPETKVVVGHSLGSVVAFEAAHRLGQPLPLLVTLGSPLGLRNIVYHRVRPQPPSVPPQVRRWVNIADRDDLVAADLNLQRRFPGAAGVLETTYTVDNGAHPHDAKFYLTTTEAGRPVVETLSRCSAP
ncbi:hypothetical protein ABJI51_39495 [Amycolatopsis sp. NEAU-NG30]|uniref:Alpha/beta hydrolase n=1 Tax=Amycolatopsis melonis TaxID=3156488 RepID=A0ABV0LSE7_9PSEU